MCSTSAPLTGMLLDHLVQKTETYPLTQEMRRTISMASVLHDIGKMEIGGAGPEQPGAAHAGG